MKVSDPELHRRFFYHKAGPRKTEVHKAVSQLMFDTACKLRDLMPNSENAKVALQELENVRMRANAAVACDTTEEDITVGEIEAARKINQTASS